ncbi:MAG: FAD-dependent oxidoreductase [Alkalispirochaetaceae bacterium]
MRNVDLAIVGAGPAGLSAAIEAAEHGVSVVVYDENALPGGQLFKQIHKFFGSREHRARQRGFRIGEDLLAEAKAAGVEVVLSTPVLGVYEGRVLTVLREGEIERVRADAIIFATGASENAAPFPGWTTPGVMTAGAAQTMMNLHGVRPGRRVVMLGSGNVGLVVSMQLLQAGCEVAAVVDAASTIGGYGVHAAKVARQGVPFLLPYTITSVSGESRVEAVEVQRLDNERTPIPGSGRRIEADTVCLAVGLSPMSQLPQIAGCAMEGCGKTVRPTADSRGATSVEGIFVAGDVAGIEEASAAMITGRRAAVAAAAYLGYLSASTAEQAVDRTNHSLARLRPGNEGGHTAGVTREGIKASSTLLRSGYLTSREVARFPGCCRTTLVGGGEEEQPVAGASCTGPRPVLECTQNIPCDPCRDACPLGCIEVGEEISGLPRVVTPNRCCGCALCVAACPGQAVFVVDTSTDRDGFETARVSLPWEFHPAPEAGARGFALNRRGERVGEAVVHSVRRPKGSDGTLVLTIEVDRSLADEARSWRAVDRREGGVS